MSKLPQPGDAREESDFEGLPDELMAERREEFRALLNEERSKLLTNAQRTLTQDMTIDTDDLADEMDHATSDYNQALAFRLRGRERLLISKIEISLERLEEGEYWWCEDCGAWIGFGRLRARPVTNVCIQCKENRERREKTYAR
jgi:DnaK suppressor protein